MTLLHRRLAALLALISLLAFISGAGLDAPSVIPAAAVLLLAVFVQPGTRTARWLEPIWRIAAVLLAARAAARVAIGGGDPVLPMVDLLLLLLCAESLRVRDGSGDARHFALTFALLIASAAYRPGPLFGLLFVAYVVCAIIVLAVGHLTRQANARQLPAPPPRPRFLLRLGAMSTAVLAISCIVFLFFPRVSRGWAARAQPVVARAVVGFSDRVTIGEHGARIEPNPEVVLRVEFPAGEPADVGGLHWRGRAFNVFDGRTWSRSERGSDLPTVTRRWPGALHEQVVYARRLADANVIFGLHPIVEVTANSRIRPLRAASGDWVYLGDSDPAYTVRSRAGLPVADSLRLVEMRYPSAVMAHLQLPPTSTRVLALADSFRSEAGSVYDQVVAIETWLRTRFTYTLDLPATPEQATLDHFLFDRRAGHCEYFSTAMAVLLRAGGVPARNVNGFLGGDWNEFGGFLTVTQNNAHSWVEVYFPGWGWIPFDPTPAGVAGGGSAAALGLMPLRFFLDGIEHRWSKWILDYDLARQSSLLERATAPFSNRGPADAAVSDDTRRSLPWTLVTILVVITVVVVLARRMRSTFGGGSGLPTRAYLSLRRSYQRAGFPPARVLPPLAFAALLADTAGADHARRAVELYMRARFGGAALDQAQALELRDSVTAAQRALRRSSAGERIRG